jgi:hypothetical protein
MTPEVGEPQESFIRATGQGWKLAVSAAPPARARCGR